MPPSVILSDSRRAFHAREKKSFQKTRLSCLTRLMKNGAVSNVLTFNDALHVSTISSPAGLKMDDSKTTDLPAIFRRCSMFQM